MIKKQAASRCGFIGAKQVTRFSFLAIAMIAALAVAAANGIPNSETKTSTSILQPTNRRSGVSDVIVRLRNGLNDVVRRDITRLKGSIEHEYPAIDSIDVRLPSQSLDVLAKYSWVRHISTDAEVSKSDNFTTSGSIATMAWEKLQLNGSGVTVAVVDSGVSQHLDMLLHVDQLAFLSGSAGSVLFDDCGHGTHVAGLIAGNGLMSSGRNAIQTFYGISRGAKILSVRVLDRQGKGTVGDVLAGMQWVLDNRKARNIRVMNMSLGHVAFERVADDPMCQMAEKLWKAGVVLVCAAGNDGRRNESTKKGVDNEGYGANYGSINSPGNSPYVITVGAMKRPGTYRSDDQVATYSGRGPSVFDHVLKPDIMAPGNRVVSLGYSGSYLNDTYSESNMVRVEEYYRNSLNLGNLLNRLTSFGSDGSSCYFRMSGTSMAAPVVSGAVALMLDANPNLTPDQIKARLMFTATKWLDSGAVADPCSLGAGYLNVYDAINSRINVTGYALSPSLVSDKTGVYVDFKSISNLNGIWGSGTMDARLIWGSNAMMASTRTLNLDTKWSLNSDVMGGTRAIWGSILNCDGTRAIWGSNGSTDGTRAIWGSGSAACDLSSVAIYGE